MNILYSISSSPFFSLTTSEFKWLHAEAWTKSEMALYAKTRQTRSDTLYKSPPYQKATKHAARTLGQWALQIDKQPALALAEAQQFPGSFASVFATVNFVQPLQMNELTIVDAAAFFFSALFISTGCDLIQVATNPELRSLLEKKEWGRSREVVSFLPELERPRYDKPYRYHSLLLIERGHWWQIKDAQAAYEQLSYLKKRRIREIKHERLKDQRSARPKRSLLGFLTWRKR